LPRFSLEPMTKHRSLLLLYVSLRWMTCLQAGLGSAQTAQPKNPSNKKLPAARAVFTSPAACAPCIHAHMDFLASDALQGRGSGTRDEHIAATYVGAVLEHYGIAPAGDNGTYIQRAVILQPKLKTAPVAHYATDGGLGASWTYGQDFEAEYFSKPTFQGPLQRLDSNTEADAKQLKINRGAVVLVLGQDRKKVRRVIFAALNGGAVAAMSAAGADHKDWDIAHEWPKPPKRLEGQAGGMGMEDFGDVLLLSETALAALKDVPDGTVFTLASELGEAEKSFTWNAVGKIAGTNDRAGVVLLSAHLDHLGIGPAVDGDSIYNGADDDASGATAVLELARALAVGPKPGRTVIFALFGSEEAGGLGSTWFQEHPPVPLDKIAANLEFEMLGRSDPKYAADKLWLTGWERSNLGPALAAHGAKLEADKRPEERFFMRSDNYVLAKKGVVAQTVSSFGLHKDYHQPSDDLKHIDFPHMTAAIGSMIRPVQWLANSRFTPKWNPGGKP
jgi:aminopeptidase YwaD